MTVQQAIDALQALPDTAKSAPLVVLCGSTYLAVDSFHVVDVWEPEYVVWGVTVGTTNRQPPTASTPAPEKKEAKK